MATFTVTNTNNSGAGSLRQEILDANALTGKDIINFGGLFTDGLAHIISLTGSSLSITDHLTIQGINPSLLTISDDSATCVFDIGNFDIGNSVTTVGNSTIKHNKAFGIKLSSGGYESGDGGGIYNSNSNSETATVNYSTIACNFDTPQEDSNNPIKADDVAGNFVSNGYNWIGKHRSSRGFYN